MESVPALSVIIPVFNRPNEVADLLESLENQTVKPDEVIVVEDGSILDCRTVVETFRGRLNIQYFYKKNSGPGLSRNYGCERSKGDFAVFLDSDCVLPPDYIENVQRVLGEGDVDAYGGPDKAHPGFTKLQKAIDFSMTSFFTTGGIRSGNERLGKFHPRSFNMGLSKEVYRATGGFSDMRFGEDIDLSIRILNKGFSTRFLKEAYVYHKRRTTLRQFFKQVFNSGIARINLNRRHPGTLRPVHAAPALLILIALLLVLLSVFISFWFLVPLLLHVMLLLGAALIRTKSLSVAILSVVASYTQLSGYGSGFLLAWWRRRILGKEEFSSFSKNFYK